MDNHGPKLTSQDDLPTQPRVLFTSLPQHHCPYKVFKSSRQLSDDFCNLRDVAVTGEEEESMRAVVGELTVWN